MQQGGSQGGGTGGDMQAEQRTLQQSLEQLGRNLADAGENSALMNRDVGTALGRANLNMQQTTQAMEQGQGRMPTQEAAQTVDALNRLALALNNAQNPQQQQGASSADQVMQDLANLAMQQGALNGQANGLMPMNLAPRAMQQQVGRMGQEQQDIASKLEGVGQRAGNRDDILGQIDDLAREAEELARMLQGGRLPPEVLARQERLFHRLLDAGRTLEKDEYSEERKGELATGIEASRAGALDPSLTDATTRFRVPTPEELSGLPPAVRRLILDYFERLNRPGTTGGGVR
jgi:hypothetical protein